MKTVRTTPGWSRRLAVVAVAIMALVGLVPTVSVAAPPPAGAAAAAAIPAAQPVAAPAVVPAKNHVCGWGIRTKYHSCDLARHLTYLYFYTDDTSYLPDVYSPNSGNYYDFWCVGTNRVTCTSDRGRVYITVRSVPAFRACDTDLYGDQLVAWGSASCSLAYYAGNAYAEQQSEYIRFWEPARRRNYTLHCFSYAPVICYNGKNWVFIRE